MSMQKVVTLASILVMVVLVLFIYPSTDSRIQAGQSNNGKNVAALTNVRQISVSSEAVIAHYFGKDVVEKIMKQPGCVSVRMYYGKRTNGTTGFNFIGVDKYGKDVAPTSIAGPGSYCPPYCD
jgi:hypothetical protein